ncbi:hypothetical protein U9M48_004392, partial [Paspalum notatum var. saurae]
MVKDGSKIRFREDKWLGSATMREQYPCLCNIARSKKKKCNSCRSAGHITAKSFTANESCRTQISSLEWIISNGQFIVKSHYQALMHIDIINSNKGVILKKENLAKRNMQD